MGIHCQYPEILTNLQYISGSTVTITVGGSMITAAGSSFPKCLPDYDPLALGACRATILLPVLPVVAVVAVVPLLASYDRPGAPAGHRVAVKIWWHILWNPNHNLISSLLSSYASNLLDAHIYSMHMHDMIL